MKRPLAVFVVLLAALACDRKKDETVVKQAGSKVGEALTEFASGVSKGVDNKMVVAVELTPAVTAKGLSRTIAKSLGMDGDKGFSTYIVSKAPFRGTLVARALGRSPLPIRRGRGDRPRPARRLLRARRREIRDLQVPARDGHRPRREIRDRPRQIGGLRAARPRSGSGGR